MTIDAALVTDTLGRLIDGNGDGPPGGNYVATVSRSGVTVGGAVVLVRTGEQPAAVLAAIGALLARGELVAFTHSLRMRREARIAIP